MFFDNIPITGMKFLDHLSRNDVKLDKWDQKLFFTKLNTKYSSLPLFSVPNYVLSLTLFKELVLS